MKVTRRSFVFSLAALASAPPAELFPGAFPPLPQQGTALTEAEKELLGHLCQEIIPADEFPGARELGVVNFIDRLLREAHPGWVDVYRKGLRSTEGSSRRLQDKAFSELEPTQRVSLLEKMEADELPAEDWPEVLQAEFFALLRSHTMNGYYSHPKWGGNRDKKSWEMIGYDDFWA